MSETAGPSLNYSDAEKALFAELVIQTIMSRVRSRDALDRRLGRRATDAPLVLPGMGAFVGGMPDISGDAQADEMLEAAGAIDARGCLVCDFGQLREFLIRNADQSYVDLSMALDGLLHVMDLYGPRGTAFHQTEFFTVPTELVPLFDLAVAAGHAKAKGDRYLLTPDLAIVFCFTSGAYSQDGLDESIANICAAIPEDVKRLLVEFYKQFTNHDINMDTFNAIVAQLFTEHWYRDAWHSVALKKCTGPPDYMNWLAPCVVHRLHGAEIERVTALVAERNRQLGKGP